MIMEYVIIGGTVKIHKSVFVQEMLSKDSLLRILLSWKNTRDFTAMHPVVDNSEDSEMVIIKFASDCEVNVNDSPRDFFTALKAKYKENIKGTVNFRAVYSMYGGIFTYEIDLNSENDEVQYITK
jgi:hypothetical protein